MCAAGADRRPAVPPQEDRPLDCWFDAAKRGDAQGLQQLSSRVPVNAEKDWQQQTALHLAARSGSLHAVQVLLAAGASVSSAYRRGKQPLHAAAEHSAADLAVPIINALLVAGADLLASDREGCTPAHHAALAGNVGALTALLDAGTPVDGGPATWLTAARCTGGGRRGVNV